MSDTKTPKWAPLFRQDDGCEWSLFADGSMSANDGSGPFVEIPPSELPKFLEWIDERPDGKAAALRAELAEAREELAVTKSQVENADANLEMVRMALRRRVSEAEAELAETRKERENAEIAVETMAKRLRSCIDSRNDHERNSLRANTALAKAINALKLAYARGHYCDDVPCPGCECGHVLDEILGRTVSQEECEQFVEEQFKPKV
jgi:DNA repair exonuclease SbcCD ATPase subunit